MQKRHPEFAQAKGAPAGFTLPAIVLKDANARYYFEDVPTASPLDIVLNEATGFVRVSAIGGGILLRSQANASKDQATKSTATLTLTGVITPGKHAESVVTANTIVNGSQITIGAITYTFKTALSSGPAVAYEVLIGGSDAVALDNLKLAINAGAGIGTNYSTGTVAHPDVVATTNTDTTQKVVARVPGTAANSKATTSLNATLSWPAATLGDGTGASNPGVAPETVTVNDVTYSIVDVLSETNGASAIANQVLFGADSAAALDNLKLAVNGGATEGTNYSTGTAQPTDVLATTNTDTTQVFEAQTLGEAGNEYPVAETITNGSFGVGVTTFLGGSEGANFDAYIHQGETVDFGIDEGVTTISVIAVGASTDVAVVEY